MSLVLSRLVILSVLSVLIVEPVLAQEPAVKKPVEPTAHADGAAGKGLTITSEDGNYSTTLLSRTVLRHTVASVNDEWGQETQVKTLRLTLRGHVLSPKIRYVTQFAFGGNDFDKDSSSPIFDAFLEFNHLRDASLRVGQFFVPFDRARTVREFALQMVDRPEVVRQLTLDRDVGLVLFSEDLGGLDGLFGYWLGLFGGDGRNRFGSTEIGFLYTARVEVRPFGNFDSDQEGDLTRDAKPRLAIGIAGTYNQTTDRKRSTNGDRLAGAQTTHYLTAATDLVFKWHGFYVLLEGVLRQADWDQRGYTDADSEAAMAYTQSGWGVITQASVMVSDHIELSGRWGHLRALDNTDPKFKALDSDEYTGGVSVYLNGHRFKIQADYVALDLVSAAVLNHTARLQLDASF